LPLARHSNSLQAIGHLHSAHAISYHGDQTRQQCTNGPGPLTKPRATKQHNLKRLPAGVSRAAMTNRSTATASGQSLHYFALHVALLVRQPHVSCVTLQRGQAHGSHAQVMLTRRTGNSLAHYHKPNKKCTVSHMRMCGWLALLLATGASLPLHLSVHIAAIYLSLDGTRLHERVASTQGKLLEALSMYGPCRGRRIHSRHVPHPPVAPQHCAPQHTSAALPNTNSGG
jgi:hypothetical protein